MHLVATLYDLLTMLTSIATATTSLAIPISPTSSKSLLGNSAGAFTIESGIFNNTFSSLSRREEFDGQPSGMGITIWAGDECSIVYYHMEELLYGVNYGFPTGFIAFEMSRNPEPYEQLDIGGAPTDTLTCEPFLLYTKNNLGDACYTFWKQASCLKFWRD